METDELKAVTDADGVACKGAAWMGELRVVRSALERSEGQVRGLLERMELDAENGDLPYAAEQVVDDLLEGILATVEPRSFTRRAEKLEREISEAEVEEDEGYAPEGPVLDRIRALAGALRAHAALLEKLGTYETRMKGYLNPAG